MKRKFGLKIKIIKFDNKMDRKKTLCWLHIKHIKFESSASHIQEQNSIIECLGDIIMKKARAMRISANLPHDLWKEIINSAIYLYNQTPREAQDWKTPYEVFYTALEKARVGFKKNNKS